MSCAQQVIFWWNKMGVLIKPLIVTHYFCAYCKLALIDNDLEITWNGRDEYPGLLNQNLHALIEVYWTMNILQ